MKQETIESERCMIMEKKYKILVTGACGVTSRSVVRSLNRSAYFKDQCEFIGTDVCYNLYGIYEGLYSRVYQVPAYHAPNYREAIQEIIDAHDIEYAIIIPEPEALYWSENPFPVKFFRIPPKFGRAVLSKLHLYELLQGTGLIPDFQLVNKKEILESANSVKLSYPMWIRDYSEGTTSGMGSFAPDNYEELKAWLCINKKVDTFMLSEFLPGRNLACFLMYDNGKLLKYGVAQRIDYLMAKVAVSGITGNTSRGKLLNDENVFDVARNAVEYVTSTTGETMNGLVVVDLKENADGKPMVTEINLRHVAFTSIFANAGFNFSEYQMLLLSGQKDLIPDELTMQFPENNIMLRDVDGLPIYLSDFEGIPYYVMG
ncbi:MAG: hypothetical protein LIO74_09320 [Ruminococcus sp.]|nr:hypothetical protein [Ruminococcus sp.]